MRKLIWILLSLAALWGGYWFVGSSALERGLNSWLSDNSGRSWKAEYSGLNTIGFPNRFDTTFRDIEITNSTGNLAWAAPFLQIFALSYKPNHIIAVWPNDQEIILPGDNLAITSDRMRGSVVFRPETALTLDRSDYEFAGLGIQSNSGWSAAALSGQFNTRQTVGVEFGHDVFVQTLGLRPAAGFMSYLDPDGELPANFEAVRFDAALAFDAPWDRVAIEQNRPHLEGVSVNNLQISWGELDFKATGDLSVDASGYLAGELEVTAQNWQGIYAILKRVGLVQDNFFGAIETILTLMALDSGDADTLVATWVFDRGMMRFGAIPLGQAPRLIRR